MIPSNNQGAGVIVSLYMVCTKMNATLLPFSSSVLLTHGIIIIVSMLPDSFNCGM